MSDESFAEHLQEIQKAVEPLKWVARIFYFVVVVCAGATMAYASIVGRVSELEKFGAPVTREYIKGQEKVNNQNCLNQQQVLLKLEDFGRRLEALENKK